MIDFLFQRFSRLQTEPGYHDKRDVSLAGAPFRWWTRFPAMQEKLERVATGASARA
jgi:hypothetical protein